MMPSVRRSLATAAVCGLLVCAQIVIVSLPTTATSASSSSCSALRAWAAPYRTSAPTLDRLAGLDPSHRRAIFSAVTPEVRAALWREHLRRSASQPDMSTEQQILLTRALTLATPSLYRQDPTATSAVDALWHEAMKSFMTPADRRIWFDLGSVSTPQASTTVSLWDRIARPFRARAQETVFCNCNFSYGWLECTSGFCGGGTWTLFFGCGPLGNKDCNGLCS